MFGYVDRLTLIHTVHTGSTPQLNLNDYRRAAARMCQAHCAWRSCLVAITIVDTSNCCNNPA